MKQKATVLFVNLNPDMRKIAQIAADEMKLHAIFEQSGQDAFLQAQKIPVNLIVIYRHSPQLDATSLSVLLKESSKTRNIPIIVICSELNEYEIDRCKDAGCTTCINENFSVEQLKAKISELIL